MVYTFMCLTGVQKGFSVSLSFSEHGEPQVNLEVAREGGIFLKVWCEDWEPQSWEESMEFIWYQGSSDNSELTLDNQLLQCIYLLI